MLRFGSAVSVAFAVAAFSALAFGAGQVATPRSSVVVGKYEVRNADRGAVKRVKVFYEGSRIATLIARHGAVTHFCCTADACAEVANLDACTTLKISCDADGWCSAQ